MKFTAYYVEIEHTQNLINLLLADPETNPDEPSVLILSRAVEFPDSVYYFEVNDQSQGCYGGLQSVRLALNTLTVVLQPATVAEFGDTDLAQITVLLDVDDDVRQKIENTLNIIFANDAILAVG